MDSDQRVDIEARMAHQERMITNLSDEVYRQQRQIDQLQMRLAALLKDFNALAAQSAEGRPDGDELPPHY